MIKKTTMSGRAHPERKLPRRTLRQQVDSLRTHQVRGRNLGAAAVAILLGLVLLTSGLGTWGQWTDQSPVGPGSLASGSMSLTGKPPVVQLLSRQLAGKRTYASATACSAASPYVECRDASSTLAQERLIPGDTLRIEQVLTVAGNGDNLKGDLAIDATSLLDRSTAASAFAKSASISLEVTKPDSSVTTITGLTTTIPVQQANTFGTYTVAATIATPAEKPGSGDGRWNLELWGQTLNLGALTTNFNQTN